MFTIVSCLYAKVEIAPTPRLALWSVTVDWVIRLSFCHYFRCFNQYCHSEASPAYLAVLSEPVI